VRSKLKLVISFAVLIFFVDHITKWWIVDSLAIGDRMPIINGFFDIVHGRNTGAAFGLLSDWNSPYRDWFFYAVGILALIFLYYYIKSVKSSDRLILVSLAMILGGACGNIFDRILRGSVVDFLSVHYYYKVWSFEIFNYQIRIPLEWPAFNVADAAITTAVLILVVQQLKGIRQEIAAAKEKKSEG
jgi:signal peptidase II